MSSTPSSAVLVLDGDSRAGLAVVQSLGRRGIPLHVGVRATGSLTAHSRWSTHIHRQPAVEAVAEAHAWMRDLHAQYRFALVVPATEASLLWLRALSPQDPLRRLALLPADDALDIALSKERTRALAERIGLPVPGSRLLARGTSPGDHESAGFPCVLKPASSKVQVDGRLDTLAPVVVRDASTRSAVLEKWLPHVDVQEQQWVPGRGVGVELVYANGEVVAEFVHERLHELPLTGGGSTLRRAAKPDRRLLELSKRLLGELHWQGVAMVEWRRADDGAIHLMEINPRLWGSLPLTIAAGVDVPALLHDIAAGKPVQPVTRWKENASARNIGEDVSWMKANLLADRSDPLLLTQSLPAMFAGWLRVFSGRETWDGWRLRDPAVAIAELGRIARGLCARPAEMLRKRSLRRRIVQAHAARFDAHGEQVRPIRNLLFLCYGNICRSPFAERLAQRSMPALDVTSAGFHPRSGRASPAHVVHAARVHAIDLTDWSSREVTGRMVADADCIVVMDLSHVEKMQANFPEAMERTTLLGLFNRGGPVELADPYALSPEKTGVVMGDMVRAIAGLARTLR
ncbi:MAG: ATP-grasp domain-containing protein [Xanthomonadales bacterium]|nr:ATP-grasp domain-containing protein [Xanthomonadales bacterium]